MDRPEDEIYLYCIRRADHAPPADLPGVGGAPTLHLERGELSAWYARLPRRAPDEAALRAHEAVVREALRTATPVPLRFGMWIADEDALAALLDRERERFLALLARVGGRVEMGVRGVEPETREAVAEATSTATGLGPGRAYLERRRAALGAGEARDARARRLAGLVRPALEEVAEEVVTVLVPDPRTIFEISFLIARGAVRDFRARADRLAIPGVELALSGPWAPYSFVMEGVEG